MPPLNDTLSDRASRLTQTGLAFRWLESSGGDWVYVPDWSAWAYWSGHRWVKDSTGQSIEAISDMANEMLIEANENEDDATAKFAIKAESMNYLSSVEKRARSIDTVDSHEFERQPELLVVDNGTLNLRTGELAPHEKKDMLLHKVHTVWDPLAKCPRWKKFLQQVTGSDPAMIEYLRRVAGYTLSGRNDAQAMFILWGPGANGKSVFMNVLHALMGDYSMVMQSQSLMSTSTGRLPSDLALAQHVRMMMMMESELSDHLAEGLVKTITGGEPIAVRFLYGAWFSFVPKFKLFLATNHKPNLSGTDDGIHRRMRMLHFTQTIPPEKRIPNLSGVLCQEELPGILAWALEGYQQYCVRGLDEPKSVQQAAAQYRDEMDPVREFLLDECEVGEGLYVSSRDLYRIYSEHCRDNGQRAMSHRRLTQVLSERGFERRRVSAGVQYVGLKLRGMIL